VAEFKRLRHGLEAEQRIRHFVSLAANSVLLAQPCHRVSSSILKVLELFFERLDCLAKVLDCLLVRFVSLVEVLLGGDKVLLVLCNFLIDRLNKLFIVHVRLRVLERGLLK
jgi:hypothetical protein